MKQQQVEDFKRISSAIEFIKNQAKQQPGLEYVASYVGLSSFHFQKLFTDWVGVSPKKFLQYITVEHAKRMLGQHKATLFDTAIETGLSGTGRLHDLFVSIESMTPGEYKNGGEQLSISYSFNDSPFGSLMIASTPKGICHSAFYEDENTAISTLKNRFPNAVYSANKSSIHDSFSTVFQSSSDAISPIHFHLRGTEFQLKVWEALLKIPMGKLATYGEVAKSIGNPTASRAVGAAIGDNPIAYLIPCHRVIRSTGIIGEYHWGSVRKTAIIGWEAARNDILT